MKDLTQTELININGGNATAFAAGRQFAEDVETAVGEFVHGVGDFFRGVWDTVI